MLPVQQMTRSIVGCPFVSNGGAIAKPVRLKLLTDVTNSRAEAASFLGIDLIIRQQMRVSSEHRAAASSVSYDRSLAVLKSIDVLPREFARAFKIAGMSVQRSTTNLAFRRLSCAAIDRQDSLGCFVDALEQSFGDAAFEE